MPYFFSLVKELKTSTISEDKEGDRVHASARGHAMNFLKAKPVEGHLYALKDFFVLENRSKFKTTAHPYKINFLRKTKMEEIFDEKFPATIYNLKSFNQLEKEKRKLSVFSFWIISCQLPPVATERGKRMEFILEDYVNNNIKRTLWDNYVDDLLPFVEAESEENIIVLIEFGRISIFGDQVRVCNSFNVTKITVNGESRVFQNFNEGLANSGSVSAPLTTFESISAPNIYDAFKNTEADVKNLAEIIRSDKDGQFWCGMKDDQGQYKYKIEVLVLDDSGSARFMLWDKECYELIGKKSSRFHEISESFDSVPKEIEEALTDRVGLFKVQVKETDQNRNSVIYNVTGLTADERILSVYNDNYVQKREVKLLCHDEEIGNSGNTILNSSENSNEALEEEHEELQEKKMNTEDVIGRIISCQLPPVATERGKRMEFILEDYVNNNIKCTLWDNYVDDLLPFVEAESEENIIVLIEFGRISIFGDQVRVCNSFNVTKITVNGESRVFQNFNEGLANSGSVSAPLTTFESISAPNIYDAFKNTEADVKNLAEIIRSYKDGQFCVSATIIQVESLKDWCYLACNKCSKKLSHASNSFQCAKCGMKDDQGQYKYKIEVLVLDDSGSARFMLWDKECYELIGKKSSRFHEISESFDSVPKEIEEALTDRVGLFKVQVKETDQNRNSVIYNVTRLTADERILSVYNDNYVQKREVKLLCHDEEIGNSGNTILNSSENSNEALEEEHEELQEKKMNTEGSLIEGFEKRRKKCVKKET
ncbi:hypothetical protein OROMI_001834 [Orobanche minor]